MRSRCGSDLFQFAAAWLLQETPGGPLSTFPSLRGMLFILNDVSQLWLGVAGALQNGMANELVALTLVSLREVSCSCVSVQRQRGCRSGSGRMIELYKRCWRQATSPIAFAKRFLPHVRLHIRSRDITAHLRASSPLGKICIPKRGGPCGPNCSAIG